MHVDDVARGGGFVGADADGNVSRAADGEAIGGGATLDEKEAFGDGGVGFVGDAGGHVVRAFGDVCEEDGARLAVEDFLERGEEQADSFHLPLVWGRKLFRTKGSY